MNDAGESSNYAKRRMQLAGIPEVVGEHLYLKPLDLLKAQFETEGRQFTSFANYDYLGLAEDRRVKRAACDTIMSIGIGAGASRLVGGERSVHSEMERALAAFVGTEDAVSLVSGYGTNVSVLGHLLTKHDLILTDELCHNSIIIGTEVSRATARKFAHNDLDALEALLKECRNEFDRVLIVVEGLYSMDGDIADLPRLIEIRDRYNAWLMVDEAHSIGVLGATGRGLTQHFGIDPGQVDLIIGTLSKAFATCGGFICGRKPVINWMRYTLPAFVYSVGISPVIAAAVHKAIEIASSEPWRVAAMQANSQLFLAEAKARGFDTGPAIGAGVVPILFSIQECMDVAMELFRRGFYVPPIPGAVAMNKPRLRFFLSAAHERKEILGAIDALAEMVASKRRDERKYAKQAWPAGLGTSIGSEAAA
jgi:8-amino-7-oxononanoate synthase